MFRLWPAGECLPAGSRIGLAITCRERETGNSLPTTFKGQPILQRYTYTDENGRPLYSVARTSAKEFPVWAPVIGEGSWGLKGKDIRLVPYHLHKLVTAESVFVVEGEKDVKTVESMGLAATTFPGGAGKWHPDYARWFAGREVIILPDSDKPGKDHAATVANGLLPMLDPSRFFGLQTFPTRFPTGPKARTPSQLERNCAS